MREHIVKGVHILKVYTNITLLLTWRKVIARQALTTTVCDKLLNAKATLWEGFYLSGFLRNLRLPWKQSLSWNFSLYMIYFLHSGCLSNLCLSWKTKCTLNSLYWMYFYPSEFWTTYACPEKQSVPWIHCIEFEYKFFVIQNFEQPALVLKNRICPEIFHCMEIFLSFRIFKQLELALKTEFALNFSRRGWASPLSRTPLANMEKLLLDLAANQLKWQHCWPQS